MSAIYHNGHFYAGETPSPIDDTVKALDKTYSSQKITDLYDPMAYWFKNTWPSKYYDGTATTLEMLPRGIWIINSLYISQFTDLPSDFTGDSLYVIKPDTEYFSENLMYASSPKDHKTWIKYKYENPNTSRFYWTDWRLVDSDTETYVISNSPYTYNNREIPFYKRNGIVTFYWPGSISSTTEINKYITLGNLPTKFHPIQDFAFLTAGPNGNNNDARISINYDGYMSVYFYNAVNANSNNAFTYLAKTN